ncbi:MAG: DUF72 domain-containing protein [Gemmatimonadota bacterium]|jgi:uncharacterized protein YecE (DUF72 family)
MLLRAGTSGFSYDEWRGSFYPQDLPSREMLRFYAENLAAVEINNTFYRLPSEKMLRQWSEQVPPGFTFVLKASQRITHQKRLKDAGEPLSYLLTTSTVLGPSLGALLFQLPPNLKKDVARLRDFLALLPDGVRAAFEFRHASWFDDETCAALRTRNAALCIADTLDGTTAVESTADWGYLRLRREEYGERDLEDWVTRIRAMNWSDAFVFFKHEDEGTGPRLARRFVTLFDRAGA